METECSDGLRALASRWSLAGDEKLLDILQNTHKKIITKCQEVNSKLEEMSSSLDDASISLQNVNNKFLALSNSQFIESRVYDDDADVTTEPTPVKEPSPKPPSQESELEMIKKSLAILQELHEPVTILKDSDTETDSEGDDGDRVVLKPKDLYSERPLPYIIGSESWKNSWHAGLIPEDSDADTDTEGREPATPQYSDSEPEDTHITSKANATISETSSELASEQDIPAAMPKATPADIAADIARRLGGQQPKVSEVEQEYAPAMTVSKTVYRPEKPQTGTIFTDEPPPLDTDSSSSEEDIFAELHTSRPSHQASVVEDLFGGDEYPSGRDDYPSGRDKVPQPRTEPKPALFDDGSDEYEQSTPVKRVEEEKTSTKKPVGGISLFGSNKGAESIGAAILKRNQRKSTSEEEETDSEERSLPKQSKNVDQTDSIRKEKDIFEDLFAKSANLEKKRQKDVKGIEKSVVKDKPAVDLFSDNLFDDVGDLFTSNVMKNSSKANQKSIFDDDDDLFAEIAAPATSTAKVEVKNIKTETNKSIFDSDDELFADKSTIAPKSTKNEFHNQVEKSAAIVNNKPDAKEINTEKPIPNTRDVTKSINNQSNIKTTKITKSIFDSDSDSDIFSDLVKKDVKQISKPESKEVLEDKTETDDIFKNVPETKTSILKVNESKNIRSPSIFDDDDDDLFSDTLKVNKESNLKENQKIQQDLQNDKDELIQDTLFNTTQNETKKDILNLEKDVSVPNNIFGAKESEKKGQIPDIKKERISDITPKPIESIEKEIPFTNKEDTIEVKQSVTSNISSVHENEENLFEENIVDSIPNTAKKESIKITQNTIHEEKKPPLDINEQITRSSEIPNENDTLFQMPNDAIPTEGIKEQTVKNNEKPMDGDKIDKEKDTLFQIPKIPVSKDLFDDEPPVFEKAKEPKRSKNVNALFDDDSEDEALFFRRSDVDDKSENIAVAGPSDRLFGIFHDEPPAIEDFEKDGTDIFDDKTNTDSDIFQAPTTVDNTEISEAKEESKISEDKSQTQSKTNPESIKNVVMDDYDDIFKEDKPKEVEANQNKSIDVHNTLSEIKENEFDDLFKSASKILHEDNDDIFKATSIDSFIKSTETSSDFKSESVSQEIPKEKDIFSSKPPEKEEVTAKSEISFDSDEELFRTLPKPDKPVKVPEKLSKDETDKVKSDIFSEIGIKTDNSNKTEVTKQHEDRPKQDLAKSFEDVPQKPDIEGKKDTEVIKRSDIKTVGRVKSMNLNIDVAKLLPGASPKKQKITSPKERDSEPSLSNSPEETKPILPEKSKPSMVKSISFDGEPNSEILDNKLSKERARIQVKRRPSTRKARREAVRKSAIDIDDSTDNSSSIDDVPRSVSEKSSSESPSKTIDFSSKTISSIPDTNSDISKSKDNEEVKKESKVTSKIVYILNDEDIFDKKPETGETLFKKDVAPPIPTLGSMYKAGNTQVTKSDDKIPKADDKIPKLDDKIPKIDGKIAKTDDKVVKKANISIFDSDSDEELFGGRSKRDDDRRKRDDNKSKKDDKRAVKGSLFGDDDDDDLFGVKSKKTDPKPQSSKIQSKDEKKSSEPVFNDPLSIIGDD